MGSLLLTGRNVRLVLLDVGAHSRVLHGWRQSGGMRDETYLRTSKSRPDRWTVRPGLLLFMSVFDSVRLSGLPLRVQVFAPKLPGSVTLQGQMWKIGPHTDT